MHSSWFAQTETEVLTVAFYDDAHSLCNWLKQHEHILTFMFLWT